ncbi:MAG: class I SAM-dependent methyltransferase, partial [Acidimicrobiia bacterium]
IDLDAFATNLSSGGKVDSVLEIGCGDGHLCESLAGVFPEATIVGVDIAENPGRLFKGDPNRVRFGQMTAAALKAEGGVFDLVVLCDVLHHVPCQERGDLVMVAWELTGPGGRLVLKDWVSSRNLATLLAYASDRFITGDTPVFFESFRELHDLLSDVVDQSTINESWVEPHRNNVSLTVTRPPVRP